MMTTLTLADILAIPFSELKERVELAERLALAVRLTPEGSYSSNLGAVKSTAETKASTAPKAAAKAAAKPPSPPAASSEPTDEGVEFPKEFEGGDMLSEAPTEPKEDELFNFGEEAVQKTERELCLDHLKGISDAKDTDRAAKVRTLLAQGKFQKLADVPDTAIASLWKHLQKI